MKEKVYAGRLNKPFKNELELKERIKSVWNECAKNTVEIRKAMKQFVPRLNAVADNNGYAIKTVFGWLITVGWQMDENIASLKDF